MRKILSFFVLLFVTAISAVAADDVIDCTSAITNADLSTNEGWNTDGTKGIANGAVKVGSRAEFDFSQTIHLAAGQYKLIAQAVYRYGGDEQAEYEAIDNSIYTKRVELYAGDETQSIKNRWEGATDNALEGCDISKMSIVNGKYVPNSSDNVVTYMKAGQYDNELVFTVTKERDIKIGIRRVDMPDNDITDYTNISAWKLYRIGDGLTNINFESQNAVTGKICTYAKDKKAGQFSGIQDMTDWVTVTNGDARAAGVFTYGSEYALGGDGYIAPATAPEGSTNTKVLGLNAVWGADVQYTKEVTLTAGDYKFEARIYNSGAGKNNFVKNLIGFIANDGTEYLASTASYNSNEWTTESFNISLTEDKTGKISLGFKAPNAGTGANHHLFIDHICITAITNEDALADAKATALAAVEALSPIGDDLFYYSQSAIDAAKSAINAATTVEEVNAVTMPSQNSPSEDKAYALKNATANGYLSIGSTVTVSEAKGIVYFKPVENGYVLSNGSQYLCKVGESWNSWSISATATKDDAYTVNITINNGKYTIVGSCGTLGLDGTAAGSIVYANKDADKNGRWTIEEYGKTPAEILSEAKDDKVTEIEALPVGDGLFYYSSTAVAAAKTAVNNATTVDAVAAVVVAQNVPVAGKAYAIKNNTADGYLTIGDNVTVNETNSLYFEAVEGGYVISNGSEYVYKTSGDWWALSATTEKANAYVLAITPVTGGYTIGGSYGLLGLDTQAAGSTVYADKAVDKNGVWTIEEYVAPVTPEPETSITIDNTTPSTTGTVGETYDITYKRTVTAGQWNGLYVPYSIPASAVPSTMSLYEVRNIILSGSTVDIKVVKVADGYASAPNMPLMFKSSVANAEITAENATLETANEDVMTSGNCTVKGVISEAWTGFGGSNYYALAGGDFSQGKAGVALPKYRWAVDFNAPAGAKLRISISGADAEEATGIAAAIAESMNAKSYSINGVEVNANAKGLIIKDGKKVLVK